MRKQKGITLIALVITIVVLLILAGISLSAVLGNNGILSMAKTAREETEKSEIKEALSIAVSNIVLEDVNNDERELLDYYENKETFAKAGDFNVNIYKILEYSISNEKDKVTITVKKENGTGRQYVYEILLPSGEIKISGEGNIEEDIPQKTSKINYVLNGGIFEEVPNNYYDEGKIVGFSIPSKTGSAFDGWYQENDFSGERIHRTTEEMKGEVTIYAKWIEETDTGYFTYSTSDTTATITGLSASGQTAHNNGELSNLIIPKKYGELSINAIGYKAFMNYKNIEKLVIQSNITILDQGSFNGCSGLKELVIPISLNTTFSGSGYMIFYCQGINKVTFTKGTGVGVNYGSSSGTPWYQATGDVTVEFEDGITSIGTNMFNGCKKIQMADFPSTLTQIGDSAFCNCTGMQGTLKFPEGLSNIGASAFYGCNGITGTLEFPSTITTINRFAFRETNGIEKLIIHEGITSLSEGSFNGCSGLKELVIPISLNTTFSGSGYLIFYCQGINKVTFTKGTGVGVDYGSSSGTPWYQSKENITVEFEEGITSIGTNMFNGCTRLQMVNFPSTLIQIGDSAFYNCTGMQGTLKFPEGLSSIGTSAFYGCNGITGTLEIPSTVTTINRFTFRDTNGIEKLIINDGTKSLSEGSFCGCNNLKELVIPISLNTTFIGTGYITFSCQGVNKVTFTKGTGEGFNYTSSSNTPWCRATGNVTIVFEEGITSIGTNTFRDLKGATFYYKGTEEEWNNITISSGNSSLTTPSFNYSE